MPRVFDPAGKRVHNVLQHLNRDHPDTVLFLARHAAGCSDAVEAELLAVDPDGVDITVRQAGGSRTTRLPFTAAINGLAEFRQQIRGILDTARATTSDEPLTSLEEQIRDRGVPGPA